MDHYARVLKQGDCVTIALYDRPEHILARITFYDKDSHPIHKRLTEAEKAYYSTVVFWLKISTRSSRYDR